MWPLGPTKLPSDALTGVLELLCMLPVELHAAVAVHEGSTLLVVINALRLLAYRDPLRQLVQGTQCNG